MSHTTVLGNIFDDPNFWAKVKAEKAARLQRIEDDRAAQALLPTCKRCNKSKAYQAGQNFCRPCSYC